jgi:hypothetical protein
MGLNCFVKKKLAKHNRKHQYSKKIIHKQKNNMTELNAQMDDWESNRDCIGKRRRRFVSRTQSELMSSNGSK